MLAYILWKACNIYDDLQMGGVFNKENNFEKC